MNYIILKVTVFKYALSSSLVDMYEIECWKLFEEIIVQVVQRVKAWLRR